MLLHFQELQQLQLQIFLNDLTEKVENMKIKLTEEEIATFKLDVKVKGKSTKKVQLKKKIAKKQHQN